MNDDNIKNRVSVLLYNWDPRVKIITFTFSVFILTGYSGLFSSSAGLIISTIILAGSAVSASEVFRKILKPLLVTSLMLILLPLTSGGDEKIIFGSLIIYGSGFHLAILILLKSASALLLFTVLLSTTGTDKIFAALSSMGCPHRLLNMIIFTWRYIYLYMENLEKMRRAMTLRGYNSENSKRSWKSAADLAGSILVRSYNQTEMVYNAMLLRGYSGIYSGSFELRLKISDLIKSILVIFPFIILLNIDLQ